MDPRQEQQSYNPFAYQTINYPVLPPQQPSFSTFLPTSYQTPILFPPQTLTSHVSNGYFNFSSHQPDLYSARVSEDRSYYPSDQLGFGGVKRERAPDDYSDARQGYESSDSYLDWKKPRSAEYPSVPLPRLRSTVHIRSPSPGRNFSLRKPSKQKRPSVLSRLQFRKFTWKRKPDKSEDQGSVSSQMSQTKKDESLDLDISFESNVLCAREKLKSTDGEVDSKGTHEGDKKKDEANIAKNRKEDQGKETVPVKVNVVSFRIGKKGKTVVSKIRSQGDRGKEVVAEKGKIEVVSTSKINSKDKAEKIPVNSVTNAAASIVEKKAVKVLVTRNRSQESQGKEMNSEKDKIEVTSASKNNSNDQVDKISVVSAVCDNYNGLNVALSVVEKKLEKTLVAKNRSQENQGKEMVSDKDKIEVVSACKTDSKDEEQKISLIPEACSIGKRINVSAPVVDKKFEKTLVTKSRRDENQKKETVGKKGKIEVVPACIADSKDKVEKNSEALASCSTEKELNVAGSRIEKKVEKTLVTKNRIQDNQEKEMVADTGNYEVVSDCKNDSKDKGENISAVSAVCSTDKNLNVSASRTEKKVEKTVVTRSRSQGNQGKEMVADKVKIEVASASKTNSKRKVMKISAVSAVCSNDKELKVAASRTEKKLEKTVVTRSRSQQNQAKEAVANKGEIENASTGKNSSKDTMDKSSAVSKSSSNGKEVNVAASRTGKNLENTPVAKNRIQENQEKKIVSGKGKVEIVSICQNNLKDKEEKISGVSAPCSNEEALNVGENVAAFAIKKNLEKTLVNENRNQDNPVKEKVADKGMIEDVSTHKKDSKDKEEKTKQVSKIDENVAASRTGKKLERTPVTKNRSQEAQAKDAVANNCGSEVSSTSKNGSIGEEKKANGVSADCSTEKVLNVGENVATSTMQEKLEKTLVTKNRKVADEGKIETVSTWKISSMDRAENMPAVSVACSYKVETRSMIKKKLGETLITQNGIKDNQGKDRVVDEGKNEVVSTCKIGSKDKVEKISNDKVLHKVATTSNEKLDKPLITKNTISEDQAKEKVADEDNCEVFSSCKDHSKDRENEIDEFLVSSLDEKKLEIVDLSTTEKNLDTSFVSEEPAENPSVPMISDVEEGEILGKTLDRNRSKQLDSSNVAIQSGKKNLQLKISPLANRKESNDSHEGQNTEDIQAVVMTNSNVMGSTEVSIQDIIGDQSLPLSEVQDNAPKDSFTKTGPYSIRSAAKNVIAKVAESAISPLCDPLPTLENNVEESSSFSLQVRDFRELLRENNAGAFSSNFPIHGHKFVQDCEKTLQNELSLVRSNRRKAYTCPIQGCKEHGHCAMKPHLLIKSFGLKREIQKSIQQKNQGMLFSFGTQAQPRVSLQSIQEKRREKKKKKLMDFSAGQKKLTWKGNEVNNSASPSVVRNEPSGLSKGQASPIFPTEDSPTLTLNARGESQNPTDNQDSCSLPKEAKVGTQENGTLDLRSISPIDSQNFTQDHEKNPSTLLKPEIPTLIPNLEPGELNVAEDLTLETKEPDHLSSSEEEGQISCEPTNGNDSPCPIILEKITDEASQSTGSFRGPKAKDSGTSAKEPYHLSWEPINENYGACAITLEKITDDVSRRTGFSLDPEAGNSVTLVKEPEHLSCDPFGGNGGPRSITLEKITDEASRRTGSTLNPEVGNCGTSAKEPDHISSSQISCGPVNSDTGLCSVILEKISDEVSRSTGSLLVPEAEKNGTSAKEPYQLYSMEEEGQIPSEHIIGSDGPCSITLERLTDEASRRTGSSLDPEAGNHGTLATPLEKHSDVEKDGKNSPSHPSGRNSGISDRLFAFGIKPKQATEANTTSISSRRSMTKETLTAWGISGLNPTVPNMLPTHQPSQLPVPFNGSRQNTWRRTENPSVPAAPLKTKQHSAGPLSRQSPGKWMKTPNSYVRKGNSLIRKSPNPNSEHTRKETEVKTFLNSLSKRSKTSPLLGNKSNSSKPVTEEPLSLSEMNEENHIVSFDNEATCMIDGLSDLATNPIKNEKETPPASLGPIVSNYRRIRNKLVRDLSSSVSGYSCKSTSREVKKASTNAYKSSRFSLVWTLNGKEPESCKGYSPLKSREVLPYLFPWKRAAYFGNVFSRSPLSPLTRKLHRLRRKNFPAPNRIVRRSLRWSKSMEKQSKKEAESAAKEQQKKRRRAVSTVLGGKRKIGSQCERIFRVGTLRYKMDPSRHSLVRIPDDQKTPVTKSQPILKEKMPIVPRRLSIDNDEYVRVGNGNQLVRDPKKLVRILASEKVRWSLHTARLRSLRKQQYCQFFTRFGKCNKEQGKCPYIHDPTKVAICSKFLKGLCFDPDCKLTHKVIPERMPDCSYFLKGICSNSSCPYRHVNVNPGASHCEDFLRGYCRDGNVCRKKHSYKVSRGMSGKKTVLCRKRKRVETESFRSKGRYFGGPSDDSCLPEVSLRLEKKEKEEDVFVREGRFMEFIRLGDDDDDGSLFSKDLLIDRGFDDRDAIVKPVAIMR